MPGAHHALAAMQLQALGGEAAYISGAAINASVGKVDIGSLSLQEMLRLIKPIVQAVSLPILVDADTGFLNVAETTVAFEQLGLAGMHIEDQVFPKRCGHLDGKELQQPEQMCQSIKTACSSRIDPNFLIVARTDAYAVEGFDALIERAKAYFDAGADMIFVEALPKETVFAQAASVLWKSLKIPLMANMTEFGKTDYIPLDRFAKMGYRLVIFPVSSLRIAMKATEKLYRCLLNTGSQKKLISEMQSREALYQLLGYTP